MSAPAPVPAPGDRELVTTRVVNAPREQVYRAWTEPEHLARWWGPDGFTNTFHVFEPRPGGEWRFVMHGPDGTDYKNHIAFVELAPAGRIVLDHLSGHRFRATATFADAAGGTEVTFRMGFESAEECARVATFAVDANEQLMDRLQAEVARMGASGPAREFTFTRLIDAPRERVFEAWTTPGHLERWFAPGPFELVVHQMDFHPGGRFRMAMRGPDGGEFPFTGRYVEVAPPERLSWTGEFATGPAEQITTVVTFAPEGKGTRLHVRQTFHVMTPAIELASKGADEGWNMTLDQLEDLVAQA